MNIELRTPPAAWPESWQGKPPAWATAPTPKPRSRPRTGSTLTREQVESDVDQARRLGHSHVSHVVPLSSRPATVRRGKGGTPLIRLWGHTGPWSCESRSTAKVAGGWSGWWLLADVDRWLSEHPGAQP